MNNFCVFSSFFLTNWVSVGDIRRIKSYINVQVLICLYLLFVSLDPTGSLCFSIYESQSGLLDLFVYHFYLSGSREKKAKEKKHEK